MKRTTILTVLTTATLAITAPAWADPKGKVGVCHRTASESNPYVLITVPADQANGHITGDSKQHNHSVTWPEAGTWNGVEHAAGDERLDYYASQDDIDENDCPNRTPEPPVEEPVLVTVNVDFIDECGTANDNAIAVTDDTSIEAVFTQEGQTLTVTFVDTIADDNVQLDPNAQSVWTYTFTDVECPTTPEEPEQPGCEAPGAPFCPVPNEPEQPNEPSTPTKRTPDVPTVVAAGL